MSKWGDGVLGRPLVDAHFTRIVASCDPRKKCPHAAISVNEDGERKLIGYVVTLTGTAEALATAYLDAKAPLGPLLDRLRECPDEIGEHVPGLRSVGRRHPHETENVIRYLEAHEKEFRDVPYPH